VRSRQRALVQVFQKLYVIAKATSCSNAHHAGEIVGPACAVALGSALPICGREPSSDADDFISSYIDFAEHEEVSQEAVESRSQIRIRSETSGIT
jgi:hypothetical protein